MKADLTKRADQIEIMDDLNCAGEVVDQTLRELEIINKLLGGNYVTINGLEKLINNKQLSQPFTIADLGCGGGDIVKIIYRWGIKNKLNIQLTGIDANPNIIDFAKRNATAYPEIKFDAIDILSEEFTIRKYDIVVGTLFFHHFSNEQLIDFFRQLKNNVRIGIVINDIHRHWFAFHSIRLLTKFFSKSAMVKFDAPLSVMRAFTRKELIYILESADIKTYSLRWMWAFRWQVVIYK